MDSMDRLDNRRPVSPAWIWLGELAGQRGLRPLLALASILLVDAVISPGFFSVRIVEGGLYGSLIDVLYRGTPTAFALGMAVVIGTKGIDLSVGAVIAIVVAVMTNLIHRDLAAPAVLSLTLATGLLCGLWNGFLVARATPPRPTLPASRRKPSRSAPTCSAVYAPGVPEFSSAPTCAGPMPGCLSNSMPFWRW
jgi:hypothetical protein